MDTETRRKINDDRRRIFGAREQGRLIAFVCECGDHDCGRTVPLTADDYAARRPGLILHTAHEHALEQPSLRR